MTEVKTTQNQALQNQIRRKNDLPPLFLDTNSDNDQSLYIASLVEKYLGSSSLPNGDDRNGRKCHTNEHWSPDQSHYGTNLHLDCSYITRNYLEKYGLIENRRSNYDYQESFECDHQTISKQTIPNQLEDIYTTNYTIGESLPNILEGLCLDRSLISIDETTNMKPTNPMRILPSLFGGEQNDQNYHQNFDLNKQSNNSDITVTSVERILDLNKLQSLPKLL